MPHDVIDGIRETVAELYPEVDAGALGVTGRILRLAIHLDDARNRRLAELGLSAGDFDVLATVRRRARRGGVNPKELQKSVMITSGGMSKRLDRLDAAGFIERHRDPQDRRGVLIKLTPQGRRLIDRAIPAVLASERAFMGQAIASERDRERLAGLLRALLLEVERQAE